MRKSEKDFLKFVKDEMQPLTIIQEKLSLSYEDALSFAEYLNKHNLVRLDKMRLSDGKVIHIVCKPLIKDNYWRNLYGNIIATCIGALIGAILTAIVPQFQRQFQEHLEKTTIHYKDTISEIHIQLNSDTLKTKK